MTGDHPIFDGPFEGDNVRPRFIELSNLRFNVRLEWKVLSDRYYEGEVAGWTATTEVDGTVYQGKIGSKLDSLIDLAQQLNRTLDLDASVMVTELPINKRSILDLLHQTSR